MTARGYGLAITTLQIVAAADGALAANKTDKLYVTLGVARADAPTFVCVVSDVADRNARSIAALQDAGRVVIRGTDASFPAVSRPPTNRATTFDNALEALARSAGRGGPCSEPWISACQPTMTTSTLSTADESFITCGRGGTATGPVLILQLLQPQLARDHAAVHEVEVNGATITLDLAAPVVSDDYSIEVIGGNYAPSTAEFATAKWHTLIALQPLCSLHTIGLPPIPGFHVEQITMTRTLLHPGAGISPVTEPDTCKPDDGNQIGIALPYSKAPEEKALRIELAATPTAASISPPNRPAPIALASHWTSVNPPATIDLQFLAVDFRWHRDCLTGRWQDSPGSAPASATPTWSPSCPRATLASSGRECIVQSPLDPRDAASTCRYHCDLATSPTRLPAEIQFERVRVHDDMSSPEVLYAWRDTLHTLDEELRSFPPAIDHKLVVDFAPNDVWRSDRGNMLNEFRVVLPTGSIANVEIAGGAPVSWASLSAPGLACSDNVRIAVFGERVYDETPVHVSSGQLAIGPPETYSRPWHTWASVGVGGLDPLDDVAGISLRRSEKFVSAGLELERYLGRSPFTLGASLAGQLSQLGYGQLVDPTPPMRATTFKPLLFQRNDVRASVGYWYAQNLHFALAAGFGWGFPVHFEDRDKVGTWRFSGTGEAMLHLRATPGGRAWLVLAGGTRFAERREYFTTDFIGDAGSIPHRSVQVYIEFRLRVRLQ